MQAQNNGSAPTLPTAKLEGQSKVSLVEAACERFEQRHDAHAATAAAAQADASKQRARDRLRLLQGSGVTHVPAPYEKTIAIAPIRSAAAPAPRQPNVLKYIAIGTCAGAIAAALLHQINTRAVSAPPPHPTFSGMVSNAVVAPSPLPVPEPVAVAQTDADQALSLQLSTELTVPSAQK
jgi:hypothetical protein